jgi:hypothetical protein
MSTFTTAALHEFELCLKTAALSDDDARSAIDRLETLERNKPTLAQLGRYAGIGAVSGPVISGIGDVLHKGVSNAFGGEGHRLRGIGSRAVVGALGTGVVPLLRQHFDRQAEVKKLRDYLQDKEKTAGMWQDLTYAATPHFAGAKPLSPTPGSFATAVAKTGLDLLRNKGLISPKAAERVGEAASTTRKLKLHHVLPAAGHAALEYLQ